MGRKYGWMKEGKVGQLKAMQGCAGCLKRDAARIEVGKLRYSTVVQYNVITKKQAKLSSILKG